MDITEKVKGNILKNINDLSTVDKWQKKISEQD